MQIKLVYCLTRKNGLTRAEFQRYWLGTHSKLVAEAKALIGMRRYVQSHSYDTPLNAGLAAPRGGLEGYDGIMEGWWDSEEQALAAVSTEAGTSALARLLDDEGNFIDFARSPLFMTHEHVIF